MALKFRRGSTADKSGSLAYGEPYVNTSLGTLQVGGASGDITLATVGDSSALNVLSVSASTFVSASDLHITNNAEIKGNLVLGGNITIGDQTSDTVAVNANLSSSLIPSINNTFDLGSSSKIWRDIYVSTGSIKFVDPGTNAVVGTISSNASGDFIISGELSGSTVAGLGNAEEFSSSLNSRLDSIQTTTASLNGRVNALETKSASLEESFHTYSGSINTYTASNNATNNTQNSRLDDIESTTGSLNTYTASNDSTNAGQDARLSSLETTSGSLVSFSSSVDSAIQFTGSNLTIKGDLLVKGTTTTINSTTVDIGDNIISLNGTGATNGGLIVRDATGGTTISGSLLWDTTNDYWKAGAAGNEDKILLAQEFYTFTASNAETHTNHSGRLDSLENSSESVNSFTASQLTAQNEQNVRLNTIESTTGSLNTYTASNDITNTTQDTRLASLETESGSIRNTFNGYTSSANQSLNSLETASGSLNNYTASQDSKNTALFTATSSLNAYTASNDTNINAIHTATSSLNTFTSSINSTIKTKLNDEGVISGSSQILSGTTIHSGSFFNGISVVSGSSQIDHDQTTNYVANKHIDHTSVSITAGDGLTGGGTIAATRTINVGQGDGISVTADAVAVDSTVVRTSGDQTIGGTKTFNNITVNGTGSFAYIVSTTGSAKIIGDAFVVVNADSPSSRYAGLSVYDSGSNTTASLFFDGEVNDWSYEYSSSEGIDYGAVIFHPEYATKGSPTYLANGYLAMGSGTHHLANSTIYDNGVGIGLGRNVVITGSIVASGTTLVSGSSQINGTQITNNTITIAGNSTALGGSITAATILSGTGVFSGSAQITTLPSVDTDDLTEGTTNKYYTDARVKTKLSAEGVISGSSQVFSGVSGDVVIASNGVATIQANSVALGTDTTGNYVASLVAGTNITLTNNSGEGATPTIGLTNNSITIAGQSTSLGGTITAATIGNAIGAFSGSSQVDHDATTNFVANEHIDHSTVSITAGSGLTGGGTIAATRTISIATGGVTNAMLANSTISGISLGSNLATLTIGTGLSGTSYNGSGAVTIANTGVTSNVAGTGISVSGATGAVTITNAGVTSNVAGTGVSVSGATGAVTISIGQAVATSSNVQFNSLGVGMAASATAGRIDATNDIVAYSSSDRRFKDNIKPIENPLEKISKISGNTFDWKEENKIEHGYEGNDVGVIAQEIEAVLPQLVQTRESGYKAVKYDKLVALLIEGIKEQQIQINDMKVEIENLKRQKGL